MQTHCFREIHTSVIFMTQPSNLSPMYLPCRLVDLYSYHRWTEVNSKVQASGSAVIIKTSIHGISISTSIDQLSATTKLIGKNIINSLNNFNNFYSF